MRHLVPDVTIIFIIVATTGTIYTFASILKISLAGYDANLSLSELVEQHAKEYGWFLKLIVNCLGYSCIFAPGFIIYKYTKATKYLERSDHKKLVSKTIVFCFSGSDAESSDEQKKTATKSNFNEFILLSYCFVGLMGSYLTWGVLQEKIMTREYQNEKGEKMVFKDSQFLVFANRFLAFFIVTIYLYVKNRINQNAPLYKYSYASFSNIISAWFQYEALKFVSFPTQVLAKSCKIIPVMIMGKIISKNTYEIYEYITAVLISFGMIFFLTGSADSAKNSSVTTLTGILLLMLYMIFDSFTSNWQGSLFKKYSMNSLQMMFGVNLFSVLFTLTSLMFQGDFGTSFKFAVENTNFLLDCVVLSISSTVGQLFIFYTISNFGPVIFTIIMTIRQAIAILLSCIIYQHEISFLGVIGILILFLAIFLRVYCNQILKNTRDLESKLKTRINV